MASAFAWVSANGIAGGHGGGGGHLLLINKYSQAHGLKDIHAGHTAAVGGVGGML